MKAIKNFRNRHWCRIYNILYILCQSYQKMADIIVIVKHLFYLKFFYPHFHWVLHISRCCCIVQCCICQRWGRRLSGTRDTNSSGRDDIFTRGDDLIGLFTGSNYVHHVRRTLRQGEHRTAAQTSRQLLQPSLQLCTYIYLPVIETRPKC